MSIEEANPLWNSLEVETHRPPYGMLKAAHRGGVVTVELPEGSLGAVRAALERGYDLLELDVRESADGVPVAHHDGDFRRSCGDERSVRGLTVAEMRQLRYRGSEEAPATLEEILALCAGRA